MKVGTFSPKVASFVRFSAVLHQFGASFWMKELTAISFHTEFTAVVSIFITDLLAWDFGIPVEACYRRFAAVC